MPADSWQLTPRWSYPAWHATTFVLTTLMVASDVLFAAPGTVGWTTYVAVAALGVLAAVARLRYAGARRPPKRIAEPLLALAALVVIGLDILIVTPMAVIVLIIPLLWLVFEFDRLGLGVALASLAGVLATMYVGDVLPSGNGPRELQFLPIALIGAGLTVSAHQIAVTLRRREQELLTRAAELREHLVASEDRLLLLRGLLETIDAVIVAYDDEGHLIWDNPAAKRLVARAGIDTDGHLVGDLQMYGADQKTRLDVDEIALARAHRGEEFDHELTWFGPPGDQVAHLLSSRQIHRADAQRYGYVIVGLEVTELLDSIRVREEFLTTVSHELRTPLTSIMGYHELLEDEIDPADTTLLTMLAIAQRNATVLLSRVGQLLQASGSAETIVVKREPVDLDALMERVLTKHHAAAATVDVRLHARVQRPLGAHVDPRCFEQVVDNLVSNALKHTPPGGSVQVGLDKQGATLRLCVKDTGAGMTPTEQRHVFDRFYRTTAANDQALQGLGVGLSVVSSIVEAHGGQVTVDSAHGRGTTFAVVIPDETPDEPPDAVAPAEDTGARVTS